MSSSSSSNNVASEMIRPISLFLSTEDAEEYSDASRVAVTLRDPIKAQDGFRLVYGLRSFGYNTNVMNISQQQRNNVLRIVVSYQTASLTYINGVTQPSVNTPRIVNITHDIILSDANYSTLDSLFSAINALIEEKIFSGWYVDYALPPDIPSNKTTFKLEFDVIDNRYIAILLKNVDITVKAGYIIADSSQSPGELFNYAAWQFADKILTVTIVPHPDKPELYNQLFTNISSTTEDRPISLPSYDTRQGINPPDYIQFIINPTTYFSYNTNLPDDPNFTTVRTNVWSTVKYYLKEGGNEHILDTGNGIHPQITFRLGEGLGEGILNNTNPFIHSNVDYIGYHLPFIHPFYMDISTSLENSNVTSTGEHKNLLHRQFVVGAKDGTNSYFQTWENPIYHILDSRYISSIEIKFESQSNRWNFFNMEYALELIIFEIEEETSQPDFIEPPFVLPEDDTLTAEVRGYTQSKTNPYPILGSGQQRKVVVYNDISRRRVRAKY